MALIEFKNLPDTSTPINATNLNNNFNEIEADSGWLTTTFGSDGTIKYRKIGKVVYYTFDVTCDRGEYFTNVLPVGYRPSSGYSLATSYNTDVSGVPQVAYGQIEDSESTYDINFMYIIIDIQGSICFEEALDIFPRTHIFGSGSFLTD